MAIVDDDILYPHDYVDRLTGALDQAGGEAVVGVHGRIFIPPHRSYVKDALMAHFTNALDKALHVHEVGTGTCAFVSDRFQVDPDLWDQHVMDDIVVAIEAQKRGLPRIAIARPAGWLTPQAQCQVG